MEKIDYLYLIENYQPMSQSDITFSFPSGLFKDVCQIIENARQRVAISVNSELTLMYWHIGERINRDVLHYKRAEYGKAIVSTLSAQLMDLYGMDFNSRNLHRMMQLAREFGLTRTFLKHSYGNKLPRRNLGWKTRRTSSQTHLRMNFSNLCRNVALAF